MHCVVRKYGYLKKIGVLLSGTLSQTPDLENFATASRSSCQQHSSSSSTVQLVDDTYTTVDESWLFTTSRSTNPLTPLLRSVVHLLCSLFLKLTKFWLTHRVAVAAGTSAGFWLGGQFPLAAWGEENFENLTTKWCILKYIWINMWSA